MRIVSLVPSLSETIALLGASEEIVGVTNFCVHPREVLRTKVRVGGTKNPDVDRVALLNPDLVVVNVEENRKEDVEKMESRGIPTLVTDVPTVEEAGFVVLRLGERIGRRGGARRLFRAIQEAIREAEFRRRDPIPVYCPIWKDPWMTMGGGTYASSLLSKAGAQNVFESERERWIVRDPKEAKEAGATAVLLPSEPYPFSHKHVEELVGWGFDRRRVVLVDGEALTWYGARTPLGLRSILESVDRIP